MTSEARIEELFRSVVELEPEERAHLLDRDCPDEATRRRVEELLAWDARVPEDFLAGDEPEVESGTRIGPYRVTERLGEGGMGTVYAARQAFPRRDVALKVLRSGRVSADTLRRFRHEIEVLGRLQHAGIARIYDAGTTEASDAHGLVRDVPYFTMEIVRGVPLVRYAREAGLSNREKAELLANVCDAVHYAHQRGVIHRDLKPENVLVTTEESTAVPENGDASALVRAGHRRIGQPKVLDFGIARVIEPDGTASTRHTLDGALLGSLSSMSPEQVSGDGALVDVRTDVYALGVMLYELLAGRAPLALDGLTVPQAVRRIASDIPVALDTIDTSLRGDLATVAAKALEKEPERRYQTALELGADLRRHLEGEPIEARGDSRLYLLRRSLRRHRLALAFAVAAALPLIGFALLSVRDARRNSELAATEARLRKRADADFAAALEAIDLLASVGAESLDGVPRASAARRELLEAALAFRRGLLDAHAGSFELRRRQAAGRAAVAELEHDLGNRDRALDEARLSVAEFRALIDELGVEEGTRAEREALEHELIAPLLSTGRLLLGFGQLDQARDVLREARDRVDARLALAAERKAPAPIQASLAFAGVRKHLSKWMVAEGDTRGAVSLLAESLPKVRALAQEHAGGDTALAFESGLVAHLQELTVLRIELEDYDGLEPLLLEAIGRAERLIELDDAVEGRSALLGLRSNYAVLLMQEMRIPSARSELNQAVALGEEVVRDHPLLERPREVLAHVHTNLGMVHHFNDELEASVDALGRSKELYAALVDVHSTPVRIGKMALTENNRGGILMSLGRYEESRAELLSSLAHVEAALESLPERAELQKLFLLATLNLGQTTAYLGRHREAVEIVADLEPNDLWLDTQRMLFVFQRSARTAEVDETLSPEERDGAVVEYLERATAFITRALDAGLFDPERILSDREGWDVLLLYPPFEEALVAAGSR